MLNWLSGLFGYCSGPNIVSSSRDALQYANQQLDVELDTEVSMENTIAKFTELYDEQSLKEKFLIEGKREFEKN
jgi:hypothetical protein